jgi:hypothetical protein
MNLKAVFVSAPHRFGGGLAKPIAEGRILRVLAKATRKLDLRCLRSL